VDVEMPQDTEVFPVADVKVRTPEAEEGYVSVLKEDKLHFYSVCQSEKDLRIPKK
jgi:hypothetical protein